MPTWTCKYFSDLTNEELYKILQLRIQVFVVEQNCPYQDCDNKDIKCYHLMGWHKEKLVAYVRLLPPGLAFKEASIGRVITSLSARRMGIGRELITLAIEHIYHLFGKFPITIGAQLYLKKFYESFGFLQTSDIYLEDNIQHIEMMLK